MTWGLISTRGMNASASAGCPEIQSWDGRSLTPRTSITVSWRAYPTCCAASPTPRSSRMVSNMSAISRLISGVTASMRAPFLRRTGSPYWTTGRDMGQASEGYRGQLRINAAMSVTDGLSAVRT